jgi:hypothetical protein
LEAISGGTGARAGWEADARELKRMRHRRKTMAPDGESAREMCCDRKERRDKMELIDIDIIRRKV